MKNLLCAVALAGSALAASPASAVTFFTGPVNSGPQAPTGFETLKLYTDFDSGAPAGLTGGSLRTGSNGTIYAAPFGDATQYYAVGPQAGSPAQILIGGFDRVSFYWGSIDSYNTISFLGAGNSIIQSFTGSQIVGGTPMGAASHTVTFSLDPTEAAAVTGIRFSSSVNAFELDNLAIGSAPEPAVWMTMILGFGFVGGTLRRRRRGEMPVAQVA